MSRKMLINAAHSEECRVAIVEKGVLLDLEVETPLKTQLRGNIYKAVVAKVEPSLGAAFVEFGAKRHGFLPLTDVGPDILATPPSTEPLKRGKEILVQVMRDEIGTKGALVSTFYSIPGRYVVIMPNGEGGGVSRRIGDEDQRRRLRETLRQLEIPEGMGVIVRTAGVDRTKPELARDLTYLTRLWDSIIDDARRSRAPRLIYQEEDVVIRTIRDYFSPEIDEILIDEQEVFDRARTFIGHVMPRYVDIVKMYDGRRPLFDEYEVEPQIVSIYERRVPLPSGGSIVLDRTEALISIDVNSGKATQEKGIEETAFRTNVEAAHEAARQLRLRDWGGLVVIDFIDMRERKNIREVERALKDAVRVDKARVKMTKISEFGLLQISRQRLRPPVVEGLFDHCTRCDGRGLIRSPQAATLKLIRDLYAKVADGAVAEARATVHPDIALYVLNYKRSQVVRIENDFACKVRIDTRNDVPPDYQVIEYRMKTEEERALAWAQRVSREREAHEDAPDDETGATERLPAIPAPVWDVAPRDFGAPSEIARPERAVERKPAEDTGRENEAIGGAERDFPYDEIPIEVAEPHSVEMRGSSRDVRPDQPTRSGATQRRGRSQRGDSSDAPNDRSAAVSGRTAGALQRGGRGAQGRTQPDREGRDQDRAESDAPEVRQAPIQRKPWNAGAVESLESPAATWDAGLHFGIPEWGADVGNLERRVVRESRGGDQLDADGEGPRRRRRRGGRGRKRPTGPSPSDRPN